jgi:integrase/recombinase XerD
MNHIDQRCELMSAYEEFLLDLEAGRRSPHTLRYYRHHLGHFLRWLLSNNLTSITEISPAHIRRYLVERLAVVQPLTVHHHAAAAKAWLNYLVREELLPASPMRNVRMPTVEQKILPALEPSDVKRLLSACLTVRDKAILLTMLATGLRASEFVALNIGDVNLMTGAIHVRHTKTHNERIVYVGPKVRKTLLQYLARRDRLAQSPLWLSRGKRLSVNGLHLVLRRVGDRAQVEHCHAHTMRRTFALWSLRAGMNIYVLQRLMGHKSLTQLQRYLSLVDIDLAQSVREHDPVDRLL